MNIVQRVKQFGWSFIGGWRGLGREWWPLIISEPYGGAWQRNDELPLETILTNTTVYRCITLIASDVAKLELQLLTTDRNDIGQEIQVAAFSSTLQRPNHYQNSLQFFEQWMFSKLITGNTYVLKQRDNRNVVNALYILDPQRTRPLVAPNGEIFYEIRRDDLSGVKEENLKLPASEIIHDRMNALYHPLWGLSPICANHLPAAQALRILRYSDRFFANAARPSGILTAPGNINVETQERLKAVWQENYGGGNQGKVAVLGSGLAWAPLTQNAVDAELIKQLEISDKKICTSFGVPGYKAGIEPAPAYDNVEALNQTYYNDCLQVHLEAIERCMTDGLELPSSYYVEFDLSVLLRMDTARRTKAFADLVSAGILAINEARAEFDYGPKEGGDVPRIQQQMIPIDMPNPSVVAAMRPPPVAAPQPETAKEFYRALKMIRGGLYGL